MACSVMPNASPAGRGCTCQGSAAGARVVPLAASLTVEKLELLDCPRSVFAFAARSLGPAQKRRQQRRCRWRVQAFDVHEALSAQAARQQRNIPCDVCSGRGWLQCDFCQGRKTEVPAKNGRIYRRCPSCKAVGVLMCSECKVYKCMTFPDAKDGGFEME